MLLSVLAVDSARAQEPPAPEALLEAPGILRNGIRSLHARGDSLWVSPLLSLTTDGGQTWRVPDVWLDDPPDPAQDRVFSIDAEGETIWAGLARVNEQEVNGQSQNVPAARGFVFSTDGGTTWTFVSPTADRDGDPTTVTGLVDAPDDTLTLFGGSALRTLPNTEPASSPPWSLGVEPATGAVWVAAQNAGLRVTRDGGETWRRVVLPPDTLDVLTPEGSYDFFFATQPGDRIAPDDFFGLNFVAYSVLVDAEGVIWAGTAGGLNRSEDGERWRRFGFDGTTSGLVGNQVIALAEQPVDEGLAIWAACLAPFDPRGPSGQEGVAVTRDGGETFEQYLLGERVFDFAFRGDTVYAAGGTSGLFISGDGGVTWDVERDFFDPAQPDAPLVQGASVLAVATTAGAVWAGTSDGLFRSVDGGETWTAFRAVVPLDPEDAPEFLQDEVPRVDTYAYPNPFSPAADRLVRIRFELERSQEVEVRIFDFGMNLVRRLRAPGAAGLPEVAWDGTDDRGTRVANGAYFYSVEAGGETVWGKVLVLE